MHNLFSQDLTQRFRKSAVVAVLVIDDEDDAIPLAEALLEGGIDVMELTLRTHAALKALSKVRGNVPQMLCGAGTVITPEQVQQVADAGAQFAVAPGTNPRVIEKALSLKIPFSPGIATPSDIEAALEFGCKILKFFPAESTGGIKHLNNISAPYSHLGIEFIPLGGLSSQNMATYLESNLVIAIGGSWIAKRDVIKNQDWKTITAAAKDAKDIADSIGNQK